MSAYKVNIKINCISIYQKQLENVILKDTIYISNKKWSA